VSEEGLVHHRRRGCQGGTRSGRGRFDALSVSKKLAAAALIARVRTDLFAVRHTVVSLTQRE
jgi:hypothetical protein